MAEDIRETFATLAGEDQFRDLPLGRHVDVQNGVQIWTIRVDTSETADDVAEQLVAFAADHGLVATKDADAVVMTHPL
jgi:hypothetical protein